MFFKICYFDLQIRKSVIQEQYKKWHLDYIWKSHILRGKINENCEENTLILVKDKYEFEMVYYRSANTICEIRFVFVVRFVVLNESFEWIN